MLKLMGKIIFTILSSKIFCLSTPVVFSYPSVLTFVLGAQKNHLIEMVLLSAITICFG